MKRLWLLLFTLFIPITASIFLYSRSCAENVYQVYATIIPKRDQTLSNGLVKVPFSEPIIEIVVANEILNYLSDYNYSHSDYEAYDVIMDITNNFDSVRDNTSSSWVWCFNDYIDSLLDLFKNKIVYGDDSYEFKFSNNLVLTYIRCIEIAMVLKISFYIILVFGSVVGMIVLRQVFSGVR